MRARSTALTLALLALAACSLAPSSASAAAIPVWKARLASEPTNFISGKDGRYLLLATNVGSAAATGQITLTDTLSEDFTLQGAGIRSNDPKTPKAGLKCTSAPPEVLCEVEGPVNPGRTLFLEIELSVKAGLPDPATRTDTVLIEGGGAVTATASTTTTISATPAPFGFLPGEEGFAAPAFEADGSPATQAGGRPYGLVTDLGFPTVERGGVLASSGHPKEISADLPPGLIGNPAATPVLCTEAELITENGPGCPLESAVGIATATTQLSGGFGLEPNASPLYNMVPPPGVPAAFGFDAVGAGIFPHIIARLRSDGDYGITGEANDVIARSGNPIFSASIELWGNPSAKEHDYSRGNCLFSVEPGACKVDPSETAFLTLPGSCDETPPRFLAHAVSWEEPEPAPVPEAEYESASLTGTPAPLKGCDALEFKPQIKARPSTDHAESPSGLEFELQQPQQLKSGAPATATLKDLSLTLPAGLEVDAASADGLGSCSPAQIGLESGVGESPARFSRQPASCPNAARIGSVEALTPLLAEYDATHHVALDPETGEPISRPLHGSLFLAKPFENPFNSLIALYLTIEDPQSGTFVKLASKVTPDPLTGQLSTTLSESPQLPVEEVKVKVFEGSRAALQTPATCGTYTTASELVPWSAPQGPSAHPGASFAIDAAPDGSPCANPAAASLDAGTLSPQAKSYSPLLFKLSRADGTQRFGSLEATLPPGLSAKLAGVGQCSEAQIAAAIARSHPGEGALEQAAPSCPASSLVGTITAGAGAGPTPLYVKGNAYLAGPYKGAPLSFVFITPAIAGPFDLGAVVVRAAVYLDPTTGQPRTVSDPLPRILQGIPLDLRSVSLRVDRPQFTLNPTSCSPKEFSASLGTTLGQLVPLSERFQVGGCKSLPYKPKLSARLFGPIHRGGHPRFKVLFTAKAGEANTKRIVLALPHSEFIDQAHFRTICTRVQFAAAQCPAGSVYGHVRALSPLLDYPLEGPIYLRSSNNKLPDAVAALRGPPSQPIEIDAVARVDSVNGGLRFTVPVVPDAPITKVIINAAGGKKGLFQNSTNICKGAHRIDLDLDGQNGKSADAKPALRAQCKGKGQKKKKKKGRRG
jgi:hypothetical protein